MSNLVELTGLEIFEGKLKEVESACNFLPDVSTTEGYEKSKRVSLDAGKILTNLEKKRKERKAEHIEKGKAVDIEAKGIRDLLEKAQEPHKEAYKTLDNAKKEREATRKSVLEHRIQEMRELPVIMQDMESSSVKLALEEINSNDCLDFYEYTAEALKVRNESSKLLSTLFAKALQSEKDAVELAKFKKESAEREQKDHDERIAKEAAQRAYLEADLKAKVEQAIIEKDRQDAIEREANAKAQSERDEILRIAAEKRSVELEKQNEMAKKLAEAKAKQDAIDAAEAAKQAQIKAQTEKEMADKREIENREADKRNAGKIRREASDALVVLGLTEKQAGSIIFAIASGEIPNVTINY